MLQPDPLKLIEKAAHRHRFEDGITEILVAILIAAGALAPQGKFGLFVLVAAVPLKWALPRLRDRFATPRAGSAVLPERPGRTLTGIVLYGVLVGCAVFAVRTATAGRGAPFGEYRWLPLFVGLFLSGGFLYAATASGLNRFYLYLAASAGGGLVLALRMRGGTRAEAYGELRELLLGLSALLLVVGVVTLIRFMRRNPVFTPEGGGGAADER